MGVTDHQKPPRDQIREPLAVRRHAYREAVFRAADLYRHIDLLASSLGMPPADLVEHGRLLWLRAQRQGARTRHEIWEFVALDAEPPDEPVDHDKEPPPPPTLPTVHSDTDAEADHKRHDEGLDDDAATTRGGLPVHSTSVTLSVACPRCGQPVSIALDRGEGQCFRGHRLPLTSCAGILVLMRSKPFSAICWTC